MFTLFKTRRIFLLFLISSLAAGNEELCLQCKCSTTNVVTREKFDRALGLDETDWSPLVVLADPQGKYLSVNCSRGRIPPKWPPIETNGIVGHFEGNGLEKFPEFSNAVKMKTVKLSLARNKISEVRETDLQEFEQLRMLDLSLNRIRDVQDRSFSDLRHLEYLDLSGNQIGEVKKWASNSNLNYLNLANNYVSVVEAESLRGLRNLIFLDLSNNLLKHLPESFSSSLNKLEFIDLTRNRFQVLPRFPRSLHFINISSNALSSLVIPQIDDLFVLDVSNNNLDDLDNVYEQLALKVFKASHNYLSTVGEWKSSELRVLDLGYNNFKIIPSEINSERLPYLRELHLDGNPLNEIAFNRGDKPFTNLEVLGLSNIGNISVINRDSFDGLILPSYINCSEEKGVFLNISNNNVKHIDEDSFHGYPICSVDLSRNLLSSIPEGLFRWENLKSANLQHNPWDCVCDLQWMLDKYLPHFYRTRPQTLFDLRCATPSRFKDRLFVFWYNSSSDIFCKGPSYFRYEYQEGKFFEMGTLSMIISGILSVLIIILIIAIVVLLILRKKRTKSIKKKSKTRSKPIFGELRINMDHKYNEISQDGSV